jgi:uncharacterized protein
VRPQPAHETVTVVVARRAKAGREAELEDWLHGVSKDAADASGHIAVETFPPRPPVQPEYVTVFRFDNQANLDAWLESPQRRQWTDRLSDLVEGEPRLQKITGLEGWFAQPSSSARMPPRWKMTLATGVMIYLFAVGLHLLFGRWLAELPVPLRSALTVSVTLLSMTYVVMPRVTRLLAGWLYR